MQRLAPVAEAAAPRSSASHCRSAKSCSCRPLTISIAHLVRVLLVADPLHTLRPTLQLPDSFVADLHRGLVVGGSQLTSSRIRRRVRERLVGIPIQRRRQARIVQRFQRFIDAASRGALHRPTASMSAAGASARRRRSRPGSGCAQPESADRAKRTRCGPTSLDCP